MTDSSKCIENFNKHVLKLIDIADNSTDIDKKYIIAGREFFNSTLKTFPTVFLDHIGILLKKNEKYISSEDEEILNYIIKEIESMQEDLNDVDKNSIKIIIQEIKNKWKSYSQHEKNIIFKILKRLLKDYNEYIN